MGREAFEKPGGTVLAPQGVMLSNFGLKVTATVTALFFVVGCGGQDEDSSGSGTGGVSDSVEMVCEADVAASFACRAIKAEERAGYEEECRQNASKFSAECHESYTKWAKCVRQVCEGKGNGNDCDELEEKAKTTCDLNVLSFF